MMYNSISFKIIFNQISYISLNTFKLNLHLLGVLVWILQFDMRIFSAFVAANNKMICMKSHDAKKIFNE